MHDVLMAPYGIHYSARNQTLADRAGRRHCGLYHVHPMNRPSSSPWRRGIERTVRQSISCSANFLSKALQRYESAYFLLIPRPHPAECASGDLAGVCLVSCVCLVVFLDVVKRVHAFVFVRSPSRTRVEEESPHAGRRVHGGFDPRTPPDPTHGYRPTRKISRYSAARAQQATHITIAQLTGP